MNKNMTLAYTAVDTNIPFNTQQFVLICTTKLLRFIQIFIHMHRYVHGLKLHLAIWQNQ